MRAGSTLRATVDGRCSRRWRWAAAVAALVAVAAPAHPAAAQSLTVAAGTVEVVPEPGIALHVPADGRIDGDGFAASVTGYRLAGQIGLGSSTRRATPGQLLLVFGLQGAPLIAGTDAQGQPTPTVTPQLVVDGAAASLPTPQSQDQGPTYYLASIPAAARDVSLQISAQGYTQSFSFTAGARTGAQPTVLYRRQGSWQDSDPVDQTITLATPDPAESLTGASIDITLSSATLTWFGPDRATDHPSSPQDAWLVLDATSAAHSTAALAIGSQLAYLSALPPSAVTLTVPGTPTPIPATLTGQGGPADETQQQSGFFGGIYYWSVPAGLTAATVTITPGSISAEDDYLGSPQTVQVPGSATFPVTFGAPYQPPAPPPSPPAYAASAVRATTTHPAGRGGSGFPTPVLVVVPVGVAVLLIALAVIRRRSPRPATAGPPGPTPGPPGPWAPIPLGPAPPSTAAPEPDRRPPSPPLAPDLAPAGRAAVPDLRPPPARLLTPPTGPPPPPPGAVRIDVLGVPQATGWPNPTPPGSTALEILAVFALHPDQGFTTEQLRSRLGLGRGRDHEPATLRRYIGDARRTLGSERIPETRAGGAYQARDLGCDALEMAAAVTLADQTDDPVERAGHLAAGLAYVRGAPFQDVPRRTYGWAEINPQLAARFTNLALRASAELAQLAIDAGDTDLAAWAADQGLLVSPTDEQLHTLYLTAGAAARPTRLATTWTTIESRLAALDEAPSARLQAEYRRLKDDQ